MDPILDFYIQGLIFLVIIYWLSAKLPFWIGTVGEKSVSYRFGRELDQNLYKIKDNILLPSGGNTETTQIDHVIVSNYGVFCIETKAYSGWIFGNANSQYWTQVIYHNKTKFYNPLRQNYAHVKAIEQLIAPLYPSAKIFSYVVFSSADKIKVSGTDQVGWPGYIIKKIKANNTMILSDAEKDKIYDIICRANISDENLRKEHNRAAAALKDVKSRNY